MPAKRKSTDAAGSQAAGSQAKRKQPTRTEDSEDDERPDATQGGTLLAPCDSHTRDRVAKEIARVLLFHEHDKRGISRTDLKKAAMTDMKDTRGKVFEYAMEHAKLKLVETFGLDVVQVVRADDKGDEEADLKITATNAKYILVNKLVRTATPLEVSEEEGRYHALVLVVLGLVRYSSGKLNEKTLWECLATMGLSKEARAISGKKGATQPPFKGLESLITKRMHNEMYITFSKQSNGDMGREIQEGPRAKEELPVAGEGWEVVLERLRLVVQSSQTQTQTQR
ncbi:MAGE family-domain-containing protein [Pavlovales sp. CCMP2436]|nr:MAGE family-domain-containing protein [Pavlovales sp. CCMP2436]